MKYTPNKINKWMLLKLPAAWLTGVRLTLIDEDKCEAVSYTHLTLPTKA